MAVLRWFSSFGRALSPLYPKARYVLFFCTAFSMTLDLILASRTRPTSSRLHLVRPRRSFDRSRCRHWWTSPNQEGHTCAETTRTNDKHSFILNHFTMNNALPKNKQDKPPLLQNLNAYHTCIRQLVQRWEQKENSRQSCSLSGGRKRQRDFRLPPALMLWAKVCTVCLHLGQKLRVDTWERLSG